jgi:hypothetical protein
MVETETSDRLIKKMVPTSNRQQPPNFIIAVQECDKSKTQIFKRTL